jgi:ADP-ribose pyrophosphatase YjhB (NUDIX family)
MGTAAGRSFFMLMQLIGKIWKKLPRKTRSWAARSIQPKFTVSAGAIVTNDEGKVLLLEHVLRPSSGWGVPGGFIEHSEQAEAAVRRELMEEVGVELADVTLYKIRTFGKHVEVMFLAKGIGEGSVRSREIIGHGWFAVEEMPAEMSLDQQFLIRRALGVPEAESGSGVS